MDCFRFLVSVNDIASNSLQKIKLHFLFRISRNWFLKIEAMFGSDKDIAIFTSFFCAISADLMAASKAFSAVTK